MEKILRRLDVIAKQNETQSHGTWLQEIYCTQTNDYNSIIYSECTYVRKASCTERCNVLFFGAYEGACRKSTFTIEENIRTRSNLSVQFGAVIHTLLCELLFPTQKK